VFQHLSEEGRILDDQGRWKTDLKADEIDVPEGVRLVVSRRLARLGDTARKVLTAAAVIGRSFPLDLVLAIAGETEDAVLDVIEETERAQLITAERGRQARYSFVHELIRSTLVTEIALPRRRHLHLRIADAIERLRAASLDTHISMLAHHLYQAGAAADPDRAIANLLRAAERAHASGAFEQALELCDQLLSFDLPPESAERARVEELRAVALLALARLPEATDPGERALAIWIARRDDAGIMRTAETVGWSLGWRSEVDKQVDALGRAIAALSPAADQERSRLQSHRAAGLAHGCRVDEALPLMAAARSSAERSGDAALLGYVPLLSGH
jgi:tetratricopeptide (TPR) repeat protein